MAVWSVPIENTKQSTFNSSDRHLMYQKLILICFLFEVLLARKSCPRRRIVYLPIMILFSGVVQLQRHRLPQHPRSLRLRYRLALPDRRANDGIRRSQLVGREIRMRHDRLARSFHLFMIFGRVAQTSCDKFYSLSNFFGYFFRGFCALQTR